MNEVYILRERLEAFHKKIMRLYRSEPDIHNQDFSKLPKLLSLFDSITNARSAHIHDSRYDDNDLDRLGLWEFLLNNDNDTLLAELQFPELLKKIKSKWIKTIRSNNKETIKVLDIYFHMLSKIVFDEEGSLKIPGNYRLGNSR